MAIDEFKSGIAKIRGLGAAKSGTTRYIHQKITAYMLAVIVSFLVFNIIKFSISGINDPIQYLSKPFNIFTTISLVIVGLYHGMIGIRVIIEDYVQCKCLKTFSLISLYIVTYFTIIIGVMTLLSIHFKYYINFIG